MVAETDIPKRRHMTDPIDPPEDTPVTGDDPPADQPEKDWKSEADKWKALARQNEQRAKANADAAKRLAEMEESQKSEVEKLAERAAAAEKAREEAELRARDALTRAAFVAAAAGKVDDIELAWRALDAGDVEYGDDGSPSNIVELVDKLVAEHPRLAAEAKPPPGTGLVQGPRGADVISRDTLKNMSPEEISAARREGRLAHLFGG